MVLLRRSSGYDVRIAVESETVFGPSRATGKVQPLMITTFHKL